MSTPEHSDLPLLDYDLLPLPALGHRVRSLTAGEVGDLLSYERAHADRPGAVNILRTRLGELDAGERPSGGRDRHGPEWPPPPAASPPAGPATQAPPASPPPHGNPAQPKGNKQSP